MINIPNVAAQRVGRSLSLRGTDGQWHHGWLSFAFEPERHRVSLQVGDTLRAVLPALIHRVRAWLDLDAEDEQLIEMVRHDTSPLGPDGKEVPVHRRGEANVVVRLVAQVGVVDSP